MGKRGTVRQEVAEDKTVANLRDKVSFLERKYKEAIRENRRAEKERDIAVALHEEKIETFAISRKEPNGGSESVAIMLASDWHVEEEVRPETVSGLNEYNTELAKKRTTLYFQRGLRLIEIDEAGGRVDLGAIWRLRRWGCGRHSRGRLGGRSPRVEAQQTSTP